MNALCYRSVLGCALSLLHALCSLHASEPIPRPAVTGASAATNESTTSVAVAPDSAAATPWFIAQYVSVYTPHGMAGFVPGCPVRLLRRDEKLDRLTVTDGQYEVEVNSTQVTNDPVVAASLRRQSDAEDQAARAATGPPHRSPVRTRPASPAPAPVRATSPRVSVTDEFLIHPLRRDEEPARAPSPTIRPLVSPPASVPPAPLVPPSATEAAPLPRPPLPLIDPPAQLTPPPPPPVGAVFLREYVSTRWEHGVAGFAPGQAVQLVRSDARTGRLTVTDGQYQVEVTPPQITSNPAVAAALWQRDTTEQAAAQAAVRQDSVARATAQRRFEEAKRRIAFAQDLAEADAILSRGYVPKAGVGVDASMANSYELHGDPYSAAHTHIPASQWKLPVSQGNSSLSDFVDGFHF